MQIQSWVTPVISAATFFYSPYAELCFSKYAIVQIWLNIKGFMASLFDYWVHGIIPFPR